MRSWWVLIIILVCAAVGVWAVNPPPALSDGITAVGASEYTHAIEVLQPIVAERPNESAPNYWLGRAYYGERQYRAALKYLSAAVDIDPGSRDTCLWYARALRATGRAQDAADAYGVMVERFPRDTTLLAEYGAALAMAGEYAEAREAFNKLVTRDTSAATRQSVNGWLKALDGLSNQKQLEPACTQRTTNYTLYFEANEPMLYDVSDVVERARGRISRLTGIKVTGYKVFLFSTWASYSRYAKILLPNGSELHAAGFSLPGLLVLWSPANWTWRETNEEEFANIVSHEMAHIAMMQLTGGEGLPTWLNEGLATYFGGWSGVQTGQVPAQPLTLSALDVAFLRGDVNTQEQAYAQVHAMTRVLVQKLGVPDLLKLVGRVANGTPVPTAYTELSGEPFDTFLRDWPERYKTLAAK